MSKDIFGLTSDRFQKRIGSEKSRVDDLKKIFCELFEDIKYTSERDRWHRLVIFSPNNPIFNGMSYAERSAVLYYLRRHPNIISKLSDKEKRLDALESMKPYLFKWVSINQKERLERNANYFRRLSSDLINRIGEKFPKASAGFFTDVFSILEFLLGKKDKTWLEISVHNISSFSGVPIENTRAALNALLKEKFIVLAYVPCEGRKGRMRLNVRLTLTDDDYQSAASGEGIDAAKIITSKDALNEKFSFTVIEYFHIIIGEVEKEILEKRLKAAKNSSDDESKKILEPTQVEIPLNLETVEEKIPEVEKIPNVEEKILPVQTPQPINIVMPEVPGLNQTLDDIRSCVTSFTKIAESMYKSETQRNELLNNIVQTSAKQREEYDDLYNQMVAMKKILNQKDRDKEKFVKAIQDALNMMMGKIISETDEFSKIPRHLMDEAKLQAHKAEVIQITVQTAEEIRKLAAV